VVGFTDINDQGQEGIELAYQTQLQGHSGSRGVVKDRLGRIVEDLGEPVDPRDGSDVQLTIDSKLQAIAYQRIRDAVEQFHAKAGSVVVLDAQTGEILAMANYPSYTPEERHNLTGGQLRNRAVTDVFEPGSTVKPFVVSKVIEDGYATPDTVLDTIPSWSARCASATAPTRTLADGGADHPEVQQRRHRQAVAAPGPARDGRAVRGRGLRQQAADRLPGVATGKRPWRTWKPVEKATMAYGYGLSASLLQIAHAYTAIARDGELAPLTLVKGHPAGTPVRIFKPQTARTMRQMLRGTVSKEGTARWRR
jgi:cell division protein FtsI (penicillin-binding protein 3)